MYGVNDERDAAYLESHLDAGSNSSGAVAGTRRPFMTVIAQGLARVHRDDVGDGAATRLREGGGGGGGGGHRKCDAKHRCCVPSHHIMNQKTTLNLDAAILLAA